MRSVIQSYNNDSEVLNFKFNEHTVYQISEYDNLLYIIHYRVICVYVVVIIVTVKHLHSQSHFIHFLFGYYIFKISLSNGWLIQDL